MAPFDPDDITLDTFNALLKRYPSTVPSKLHDLDELRYHTIPSTLSKRWKDENIHLTSSEAHKLVEWKLKHGTFRPKLLQLVQSNPSEIVERLSRQAYLTVRNSTDSSFNQSVKQSIKTLTEMKGIGPATASLLLSVCFPATVPFFSDELFRWGVGGGKDWGMKIGYTAKEYGLLVESIGAVRERLGVAAVEVEKVAWVLGRERVGMNEDVQEVLERLGVGAEGGEEGVGKADGESVGKEKKEDELRKSEADEEKDGLSDAEEVGGGKRKASRGHGKNAKRGKGPRGREMKVEMKQEGEGPEKPRQLRSMRSRRAGGS